MEYLVNKKSHPTVDEIHSELVKEIPTLSKTTIYNTLDLFIEEGLVRVLTIEDNETRYDAMLPDHGHFKCQACGKVYDFSINIDSFVNETLAQFKVTEKNVYFKGICHSCTKNEK
jgi:Fe2+ or Zn2+ uptake regulation protein